MLIDHLESYGLTQQEAQTYLSCLEIGPASILDISRKTKQNRTQLYLNFDRLVAKKLVTITTRGKRKLFSAEPPTVFKDLLKEKLLDVDTILPDLLALTRKGSLKPIVKFYDGLEGIKDVYRASRRAKEPIMYGFIGLDLLNATSKALMHFWTTELTSLRKRHKAIAKIIVPDTEAGKNYKAIEKEHQRETRLLPASSYSFPGAIILYDDVVCMYVYSDKEAFAVTVQSEAIATTVKMAWRLAWGQAY